MVPGPTDPRWVMLVTGRRKIEPQFLAMRLLMQRIAMRTRRDTSPETVDKLARELHEFCVKYENLLGADLAQINRWEAAP